MLFSYLNISRGSVGCSGIFKDDYCKFTNESINERQSYRQKSSVVSFCSQCRILANAYNTSYTSVAFCACNCCLYFLQLICKSVTGKDTSKIRPHDCFHKTKVTLAPLTTDQYSTY